MFLVFHILVNRITRDFELFMGQNKTFEGVALSSGLL